MLEILLLFISRRDTTPMNFEFSRHRWRLRLALVVESRRGASLQLMLQTKRLSISIDLMRSIKHSRVRRFSRRCSQCRWSSAAAVFMKRKPAKGLNIQSPQRSAATSPQAYMKAIPDDYVCGFVAMCQEQYGYRRRTFRFVFAYRTADEEIEAAVVRTRRCWNPAAFFGNVAVVGVGKVAAVVAWCHAWSGRRR